MYGCRRWSYGDGNGEGWSGGGAMEWRWSDGVVEMAMEMERNGVVEWWSDGDGDGVWDGSVVCVCVRMSRAYFDMKGSRHLQI